MAAHYSNESRVGMQATDQYAQSATVSSSV
jgi:hypothetical protein